MKTMDKQPDLESIRLLFRSLAQACALVVRQVTLIEQHLNPGGDESQRQRRLANIQGSEPADTDRLYEQVIIDPSAKTVTYRGRSCRLGNTLVFRLIERLARRPNQYVPFDRLLRDVWDDHPKSDEAIRSLANELRTRLRQNGMRKLSSSVHGQNRAYALMTDKRI